MNDGIGRWSMDHGTFNSVARQAAPCVGIAANYISGITRRCPTVAIECNSAGDQRITMNDVYRAPTLASQDVRLGGRGGCCVAVPSRPHLTRSIHRRPSVTGRHVTVPGLSHHGRDSCARRVASTIVAGRRHQSMPRGIVPLHVVWWCTAGESRRGRDGRHHTAWAASADIARPM